MCLLCAIFMYVSIMMYVEILVMCNYCAILNVVSDSCHKKFLRKCPLQYRATRVKHNIDYYNYYYNDYYNYYDYHY